GLGFKTVKAIAKPQRPTAPVAVVRGRQPAPLWANPVQRVIRARVAAVPQLAGSFEHPGRAWASSGDLRRLPGDGQPEGQPSATGLAATGVPEAAGSGGTPAPAAAGPAAGPGTAAGALTSPATDTTRKIVASVP